MGFLTPFIKREGVAVLELDPVSITSYFLYSVQPTGSDIARSGAWSWGDILHGPWRRC